MCLERVTKRYQKPTNKVIWVYKKFTFYGNKILFHYQGGSTSVGVWVKSSNRNLISDLATGEEQNYKSGFHAYSVFKQAQKILGKHDKKILRVKFRKVVAEGVQDGASVVVAKEMYIPKTEFKRIMKEWKEADRRI